MSHGLTPLLKASIGFAYIGGFGFLGDRRIPVVPTPPPPSPTARVHRGDLDLVDRGAV